MICCFQRFLEACILHDVFAECQQRLRMFLCKTTFAENWFWRVAEFDVEMMNLDFCHMHGNLECRLLSSHVHARQQTPNLFQPGFYFNNFVDVKFCGTGFTFLLHVSDWKGMFVDDVKFVFQQQLHGRFFTGTWMTLLSEFDAPARCTST